MDETTGKGDSKNPKADLVDPATRARRRERLQTLLAKGGRSTPALAQPAAAKPQIGGLRLSELLRNKGLQRAYRLLVDTPADAEGMVPDTPFSVAGVKKLIGSLQARSGQEGQAGARAVQALLTFMAPASDAEEQIEGLSVAKLQRISKLARPGGKS